MRDEYICGVVHRTLTLLQVRFETHAHQAKRYVGRRHRLKPVADTESTLKRTSRTAKLYVMATCLSRFSVSDAGFEPALAMPKP